MSSSVQLANMADDKVLTRCLMADVSMAFPETLAFMYKSDRQLTSVDDKIKIINLDKNYGLENLIKEEVNEFVAKPFMDRINKVRDFFFMNPNVPSDIYAKRRLQISLRPRAV